MEVLVEQPRLHRFFLIMYKNVPSVDNRNRQSWRSLVKECIAHIKQLRITFFWSVLMIFSFKYLVFGSLQTSLLCIMGELAGGGSVAVGISDSWYVTCDMLLSAHIERFRVTCMWEVTEQPDVESFSCFCSSEFILVHWGKIKGNLK